MNQDERSKINRIMDRAERKIWVTFRKEGIHKYTAAATILHWRPVMNMMFLFLACLIAISFISEFGSMSYIS